MKCKVCGKRFTPKAEKRYLATQTKSLIDVFTGEEKVFECFNCPRCGCQIVVQPVLARFEPYETDETEKACDTLKDCEKIEIIKCEKCRYFFDDRCNHPKNKVAHKCPDFGEHYSYAEGIGVSGEHFCSYAEQKEIEGEI